MATKEKLFKRGVGFTFTPSRIPDESDDYIDELNVLLVNSNLSQNKFLEVMLKDAIEYVKLRNSGSLPGVEKSVEPLVSLQNVSQSVPIAAEIPASIEKESVKSETVSIPAEPVISEGVVIQKDTSAEEVFGAETTFDTPPVQVIDDVMRRAIERANRAKLKPQQ